VSAIPDDFSGYQSTKRVRRKKKEPFSAWEAQPGF
jgi:hypothetical protein